MVLDLFVKICNTYFMMNKKVPVKKNFTYYITAHDISAEGHGIGSVEGFTVFCPGLLPGETAQVLIIKVLSSYAVGKLLEIIEVSPDRVQPMCPAYQKCGGCTLSHMRYEAQLAYKAQHVENCLRRIGKITDFTLEPIIPCPTAESYRNKAQYRFGRQEGHIVCGFYREHSHQLVPTPVCMIEAPGPEKIRQAVCQLAEEFNYTLYDEATHTGLLRSLLIRTSYMTGQCMVVLVINGKTLPEEKHFIQKLTEACPTLCSIYINENTRPGNAVLGEHFRKLWGEDKLIDAIGDAVFHISPGAFYQVNSHQVQNLYETAAEFSGAGSETNLLDLYCGVGTIGIYIARTRGVKKLYGVEYVEKAIADAEENAALNGLTDYTYKSGDVGKILGEDGPSFNPQVVVLDPPRKGCDRKALEQITALTPDRIVYVSCNPATLARDAAILEEQGYQCEKVRPVDMFPGTSHVETVVLLSHKKPDTTISVKVEFGEGEGKVPLDKIAERAENYKPKERVTYKMIKEYIEAKYGYKVHTAYIAEVKRDLELPMYDAPNAVEELKQPRKHPTAEKVEAIKDALKHFEVI